MFEIKEGELTTISEVHAGARLNGDIKFINHHLELGIASNQEPIDSNHSNSLCLDLLQKPSTLNEVHQYKLWNNKQVSQKVYQSERDKAASKNDFFILFTTQNCDKFNLPENSGIVDKGNWKKYFGPFAGRGFIFAPLDINTASRTDLQQVKHIGLESVEIIMRKRPFLDIKNAMEKTGLAENVLEKFKFPTQKYHSLARISRMICHNICYFI